MVKTIQQNDPLATCRLKNLDYDVELKIQEKQELLLKYRKKTGGMGDL